MRQFFLRTNPIKIIFCLPTQIFRQTMKLVLTLLALILVSVTDARRGARRHNEQAHLAFQEEAKVDSSVTSWVKSKDSKINERLGTHGNWKAVKQWVDDQDKDVHWVWVEGRWRKEKQATLKLKKGGVLRRFSLEEAQNGFVPPPA